MFAEGNEILIRLLQANNVPIANFSETRRVGERSSDTSSPQDIDVKEENLNQEESEGNIETDNPKTGLTESSNSKAERSLVVMIVAALGVVLLKGKKTIDN